MLHSRAAARGHSRAARAGPAPVSVPAKCSFAHPAWLQWPASRWIPFWKDFLVWSKQVYGYRVTETRGDKLLDLHVYTEMTAAGEIGIDITLTLLSPGFQIDHVLAAAELHTPPSMYPPTGGTKRSGPAR